MKNILLFPLLFLFACSDSEIKNEVSSETQNESEPDEKLSDEYSDTLKESQDLKAETEPVYSDEYSAMITYKSDDLGVVEYLNNVTANLPSTWHYSTKKNKTRIELNINRENDEMSMSFPNEPNIHYTIEDFHNHGFALYKNGKRLQWYQQIIPEPEH